MNQAYLLLAVMLFLLLAVGITAIVYNLNISNRIIKQFENLGQAFGLRIDIPKATLGGFYQRNPTLYGFHQGREMSIYPRGYGMDNTRQTDIAIRLQTQAPSELAFSFGRRNALTKLGQIGRLKVAELATPAMQQEFSLRSNNPGATRGIFTPKLCQKIEAVWTAQSGLLTLRDKILTYEETGLPRSDADSAHIEGVTRICLEIAEALDGLR